LAEALGKKRILVLELRLLVKEVCERKKLKFDGPRPLDSCPKQAILDWVRGEWKELGPLFTEIAMAQRPLTLGITTPE
jgi:hypothetical protein